MTWIQTVPPDDATGRLKLEFDPAAGMFAVRYHGHRLPIDPTQYPRILAPAVRALEALGGDEAHNAQALRSLLDAFARLPRRDETARARMDQRNLDKEIAKGRLARLARASAAVAGAIARALEQINGRPDDPSSFRMSLDGVPVAQTCGLSTFSEYTTVSVDSAVKVDKDLPLDKLCLLRCGVGTGWGAAVNSAEIYPGQTVIVQGIGGIGINAVQGAAHAGAARIIAVDPVPFKRESALRFGATHAVATCTLISSFWGSTTVSRACAGRSRRLVSSTCHVPVSSVLHKSSGCSTLSR